MGTAVEHSLREDYSQLMWFDGGLAAGKYGTILQGIINNLQL